MAKLTYQMLASLDGYVQDRSGDFSWANPDEDVHSHASDEQRRIGTDLYGRKMYETMIFWETADQQPGMPPVYVDFAKAWQDGDKIVVSGTLTEPKSRRTRIVPSFGADEVRVLKAGATRDIAVSGPTLASSFLKLGLVDEIGVYVTPIIVGGGLPMFKDIDQGIRLERIEERSFNGGFSFIRYAVRN